MIFYYGLMLINRASEKALLATEFYEKKWGKWREIGGKLRKIGKDERNIKGKLKKGKDKKY